ncbi:hypothetical protein B0H66DRAFT_2328 [Apodospora peruviana]|uniref:Uncharacterized protein n=1 Tax=Apodospora peruviana TaxID=516989 RepID=A0AAE0IPG9_9PEZI|nr:hypothetical protein B0H66DRAFT_2328 [Apodospora peruviana]
MQTLSIGPLYGRTFLHAHISVPGYLDRGRCVCFSLIVFRAELSTYKTSLRARQCAPNQSSDNALTSNNRVLLTTLRYQKTRSQSKKRLLEKAPESLRPAILKASLKAAAYYPQPPLIQRPSFRATRSSPWPTSYSEGVLEVAAKPLQRVERSSCLCEDETEHQCLFAGSLGTSSARQRDKTPTVSARPNIIIRSFHANKSYRSNCDSGSPCLCSECRDSHRKPICQICKVNATVHQSSELTYDRKGLRGYDFTSSCEPCWGKHLEKEEQREQARQQSLAAPKEKLDQLMDLIKSISFGEQVPVSYAVQKLLNETKRGRLYGQDSPRWHQRHLHYGLSEEPRIVKARNR